MKNITIRPFFLKTHVSWLASLAFILLFNVGLAQESCYQKIRTDGLKWMQQQNYGEALNQFWAARSCADLPPNNDLDALIKNAQESYLQDLQQTIIRTKEAEKQALAAKKRAENAKEAEKNARQEAEENAEEARRQGKMAEALRLALLSDIARQKGQKSEALMLSFLALELSDSNTYANVIKSFAEAVKDSFNVPVMETVDPITDLHFPLKNQSLLTVTTPSSIEMIDLSKTSFSQQTIEEEMVLSAAKSGNIPYVLTRSYDRQHAKLWSLDSGSAVPIDDHNQSITSATFSQDAGLLVTCSRDHTAIIWDSKGAPVARLSGHTGNVYEAGFSSDGKFLYTRSSDGTVRIWDTKGKELTVLGDKEVFIHCASFSPEGDQIITGSATGYAKVWDLSGKLLFQLEHPSGPVKEAFFLPSGKKIITRSLDENLRIWDLKGDLLAELPHSAVISGLALSPKNNKIASWALDGTIKMWDMDGQLSKEFTLYQSPVVSSSFSSDGNYLLSTSFNGQSHLWDTDGNLLMEWDLDSDRPHSALFSDVTTDIITVSKENTIVSICPMPLDVYDQLQKDKLLLDKWIEALRLRYNIQFF